MACQHVCVSLCAAAAYGVTVLRQYLAKKEVNGHQQRDQDT